MSSKKGNAELLIFLAVAVTALGGIVFFLLPVNSASGQAYNVPKLPQAGNSIYQSSGIQSSINELSGHFVLPAAKEYGGGISGVSIPGSKAFPGGRAIELPDQSWYTCSCMEQGITSVTREAAEKVCTDNCGGDIVSIVVGEC